MVESIRPLAPTATLDAMLKPNTIAVVGASRDQTKWGGKTLKFLKKFGYSGRIYPVNPKYEEIASLKCYASPLALPRDIDLAIVILPARLVPSTLEELAEAGVKTAIILSSGFAELDNEGEQRQELIRQLASRKGIRVCGPNGLGIINVKDRIPASPSSGLEVDELIFEPIGLISQSGAIGLAMTLNRAYDRGVGFSLLISTGNEADLETADFLAFLAREPNTKVIAIYSEGFHDGRRFLLALDKAISAGKPVILLKAGRSHIGQQVATSHTGMIAASTAVVEGVCRQKGVILARDFDDLFEKPMLFVRCPLPAGRRVGIVTTSGGIASILGDLFTEYGVEIPQFKPGTLKAMRQALPLFNSVGNPLDISGQYAGDAQMIWTCLSRALRDANVDLVVLTLTTPNYVPLAEILLAQPPFVKPLVILAAGGSLADEGVRMIEKSQRFPVFRRADKLVEGIGDLMAYGAFVRENHGAGAAKEVLAPGPDTAAIVKRLEASSAKVLSEHESKELLVEYGVPITQEGVARSREEAVALANTIGYPVVLKIHGPELAHKTELGGVSVNISSDEELAFAYDELLTGVLKRRPDLEVEEVLVQQMIKDGMEVLAGVSYDPDFGPIVTCGLGGVLVHLTKGHVCRVAPLSFIDAQRMVQDSNLLQLLRGLSRGESARHRKSYSPARQVIQPGG